MKGNGGGSRERLEELSEHLASLTLMMSRGKKVGIRVPGCSAI